MYLCINIYIYTYIYILDYIWDYISDIPLICANGAILAIPFWSLALLSSWQATRRPKSIQLQQISWRTPKSRTWAWPSLAARS